MAGKMAWNLVFVTSVLLSSGVIVKAGTKCYTCSSTSLTGGKCNDPTTLSKSDQSMITDCSASVGCTKTKSTAGSLVTVTRACGGTGSTSCTKTSLGSVSSETCYCKGDYCNGAEKMNSSYAVVICYFRF